MATSSALKERFFEMAGRVEQMGKLIDPRSLNSLKTARESLGIIIEDLQVMTAMGKNEPNKDVMGEVHALLQQTMILRDHLDRAIAIQPSVAAASIPAPRATQTSSSSSSSIENQILNDNEPLTREEMARLFLFTARAWKVKMVSDRQRGFIKDVIVRREGYLRVILNFNDISTILGALVAVGGSDEEASDSDDK